jgi:hypothetical protein
MKLVELGINSGVGEGYDWTRELHEGETFKLGLVKCGGYMLPVLVIHDTKNKMKLVIPWHSIQYMRFVEEDNE